MHVLSYVPHVIYADDFKVLMFLKIHRKSAIPLEYPSTVNIPSYWAQCVGIKETIIGLQCPDRGKTFAAK